MYSVSLGKTQFAISCVMCFPMDSGPNTDSLRKTQFATSCVMCFPMDSGPNTDSLGKTQFATSCVMCFPMDSGPNTDSLEKPKPKARGPEAFRLSVCPVWSLGRLVFSSVFSGFKACHVTAAKMLPPLSGMFLAQTSPPHSHLTPGW